MYAFIVGLLLPIAIYWVLKLLGNGCILTVYTACNIPFWVWARIKL